MRSRRTSITAWAALTVLMVTTGHTTARAADITGAGATFPYPIYARWADAYSKETGTGLAYQAIGSGGGIRQIKAGAVTFGATDRPLPAAELEASGLVQFPMILGGVVVVVNARDIKAGALVLDGPTLAGVYLGTVSRWNDPAIRRLNPHLALPDAAIIPVHRSDGSGSNYIFTYYLSQVSPAFREKVGANIAVDWPAGIGSKGCEGVANITAQTPGALAYVEYAYARQNNLVLVSLINRAGRTLVPGVSSFQAAAANADWAHAPGYELILTDQPGEASWPIVGASFILMPAAPQNVSAATQALKLFDWAWRHGAQMAEELDYVPLPANLIESVEADWRSQPAPSAAWAVP